MKLIVGFRRKSVKGGKKEEFVLYNPKTKIGNKEIVKRKIISAIKEDPNESLDFVLLEGKDSYIRSSDDLAGEVINIVDDSAIVEFEQLENGIKMNLSENTEKKNIQEAFMRQNSIDQMKMVHKLMGNMDIGDRVAKDEGEKNAANLKYIKDPYENMESYEDAMAKNKHFIPNWNVNQISLDPFKYNKPHGSKTHKEDPDRYNMHKVTHLKENSVKKFNEFSLNEGLKSNIFGGLLTLFSFGLHSQDISSIDKIKLQSIKKNLSDSIKLDNTQMEKIFSRIKENYPNVLIDSIKIKGYSENDISTVLDFMKSNFLLLKINLDYKNNSIARKFLTSYGINNNLIHDYNTETDSSYLYFIRVKLSKFGKNGINVDMKTKFTNPLSISRIPSNEIEKLTELDFNVKKFNIKIDASSELWSLLFQGAFDLDGVTIK